MKAGFDIIAEPTECSCTLSALTKFIVIRSTTHLAYPTFTIEELEREEWREIAASKGVYAVSNLGRVKRVKPGRTTHIGKMLSPGIGSNGYPLVVLRIDGKSISRTVHSLVAEAFIGECPPKHVVNHKDTDKTNCRLSNLEHCTHKRNIQHASEMGCFPTGAMHSRSLHPELIKRGEDSPSAKTTEAVVRAIRAEYIPWVVTNGMLAKKYGLRRKHVEMIVARKIWKHVD